MTRRIVQIEVSPSTDGSAEGLYALCEDGSIYYGWWNKQAFDWRDQLPPAVGFEPPAVGFEPPAVEPDPIAELEAMGGTIQTYWSESRWELTWFTAAFTAQEPVGEVVRLADIRAAAARLLARVRGAK